MVKRALFIFDWARLTEQHLAFIQSQAEKYDELIFLLDRAEELGHSVHTGELLASLKSILSSRLNKPFYLFPVPVKGLPELYRWIRWRMLCPTFITVYIDDPSKQEQLQLVGLLDRHC